MVNPISYFIKDADFKKFLGNVSLISGANVAITVIGLIQSIFVARYLGVENFGLLALVMTYVLAIEGFLALRVSEMVLRYATEFWSKGEKLKTIAIAKLSYIIDSLTSILALGVILLTSSLIATYLIHNPNIKNLIILYSLIVLFSAVNNTSRVFLRIFDKFFWLSAATFLGSLFKLILVLFVFFAKFEPRLQAIIIAYLIGAAIEGCVFLYLAIKLLKPIKQEVGEVKIFSALKGELKEIGRLLFHTNITGYLRFCDDKLDIMLLGYFTAPAGVGFYKLAKNIASVFGLLSNPLYSVIYPVISKMCALKEKLKLEVFLKKSTLFIAFPMLLALAIILIFAPWLIETFFGGEFLPSVTATKILSCATAISLIPFWFYPLTVCLNKAHIFNLILAINGAIWIIGGLTLIPLYGITAAASIFFINRFLLIVIAGSLLIYYFKRYRWEKIKL